MSITTHQILEMLTEGPYVPYPLPPSQRISRAEVDYFAVTLASGARGRFKRTIGMNQLNLAQSETAVLFYLRKQHPKCEIIIQRLEFK